MAVKKEAEAINLADVQAQIAEMLAQAKAEAAKIAADAKTEAAKIVADAKASVSGGMTEEQKKAAEAEKAYYNEEVEIELFKDNGKYKDDVFVAVNGVGMVVPRGKPYKIKRKYAIVLENSLKQDKKAIDFMEMKVKEAQEAEKNL